MRTVTIPQRFCGPPQSANGGWMAGLLADEFGAHTLGSAVEVTLSAPPPLDTPLLVVGNAAEGALELHDGATIVARARAVDALDLLGGDIPEAPAFEVARACMAESPMLRDASAHPFPGCFVCGPDRAPGDGLRLFPSEWFGHDLFVAAHRPQLGECGVPYVWAALDCPSSFPMYLERDPFPGPLVLGRMTATVVRELVPDEPLVITAWRESAEGRKLCTQVAMRDDAGRVVGRAAAVWIRLRPTS